MLIKAHKPGGPVLRDGTPVADLIDRERREIAQRVFNDPEIYELELERLFARTWNLVGHESEIPNAGDFVTRRIGEDPVILVRERDGTIGCLLNVCPHRGTTVCRTESGNAATFRCIYHGWTFNLDGTFRGAPFKDEMYSEPVDSTRMELRRARVETFCGIIFANWDESAPSLDEFLGDFRWYLNLIFNRAPAGYEVLGAPHRFVVKANWKTAAEQFAGDAWHAVSLHRSLADFGGGDLTKPEQWALYDPKVSTKEGHGLICFSRQKRAARFNLRANGADNEPSPLEKLMLMPPAGMTKEMVPQLADRFSSEELRILAETPPGPGNIFPNVGVVSQDNPLADMTISSHVSLRTHTGIGPDKFEITVWTFVARGAPEEFRNQLRQAAAFTGPATGFVEMDDATVWSGQTIPARGFIARQNPLKYWALSGDGKPHGWPGPGNVQSGFSKDDGQWRWWRRYFDILTGSET